MSDLSTLFERRSTRGEPIGGDEVLRRARQGLASERPRRGPSRPFASVAAIVLAVVVLGVVALAVHRPHGDRTEVTATTPSSMVTPELVGRPSPPLSGRLIDVPSGSVLPRRFDLTSLRGKWVVVDFFASWCLSCGREAQELHQWAVRQPGRAKVTIVHVVFEDGSGRAAGALRQLGDSRSIVVMPDSASSVAWRIRKVPSLVLLAPDGTIATTSIDTTHIKAKLDGALGRGS